jgi:hypothetical protein
MADTTTTHQLLVTTFATADALAKLLIEKGRITQDEYPIGASARICLVSRQQWTTLAFKT